MNDAKKYNVVIFLVLSLGIFALLLILASFFDLQISGVLADLGKGEYFSKNAFARVLEIFGEMPLYLFLIYAFSVVFWNGYYFCKNYFRLIISALFLVAIAVVSYAVPKRIHEYFVELDMALLDGVWVSVFEIGLALALSVGSLACVMLTGKENIKSQLSFAIVIMFTAAVSQAFTQGLKFVNKRVRFRAMNALGDFGYFTPWYSINGYPEEFRAIVGVLGTNDAVRSFPSGHTTAAGITYSLIAIPYVFNKYNNRFYKVLLYAVAICYTGLVALSRIIMGAHYFSDVLVGGSVAFFSAALAVWFIYRKRAIKPLNDYCNIADC